MTKEVVLTQFADVRMKILYAAEDFLLTYYFFNLLF